MLKKSKARGGERERWRADKLVISQTRLSVIEKGNRGPFCTLYRAEIKPLYNNINDR